MSACRIAVVVSGFPRRSETFATNELLALAERDALAAIFATKPGDDAEPQPGHQRLLNFLRVLPDGTPARQAAFVATALLHQNVTGVHGYFAHTPAEVARHAAERLQVPFGFSVHAKDARKIRPDELGTRANRAACVIACNNDVASTIRETGARRVHLVPHGVDLKRFNVRPPPAGELFQILAVGRLVEKKGFHLLIAAASRLKFPFRLRIVGEGPEQERLAMMISTNRLEDRITLCGPRTHGELPEEFAMADVVAAPSIMDTTGDRDGLPNVVLEAMACGRLVVASDAGAISVAVKDGETGILLPSGDPVALAAALTKVALDPALREKLGQSARKFVEKHYELTRCGERFCQLIEDAYA